MIKKIKNCVNCPLCHVARVLDGEIEAFCAPTSSILTQAEVKTAIDVGDDGIFIPTWCPLKQSDFTITLDSSLWN